MKYRCIWVSKQIRANSKGVGEKIVETSGAAFSTSGRSVQSETRNYNCFQGPGTRGRGVGSGNFPPNLEAVVVPTTQFWTAMSFIILHVNLAPPQK